MSYTKKETVDAADKGIMQIQDLYKAACVNWTGTTKDTKELYSEVIANHLLRNLGAFDLIPPITRTGSYFRKNHQKIEIDLSSNRAEEIFAKRIAYLDMDELGIIKDYQIPLKNTRADKGVGKIDLISFNKQSKTLYLIELKYDGNKDTLLRATLESYTYFKTVDQPKLIQDFMPLINHPKFANKQASASQKPVNPADIVVKPAVLLTPNCQAYDELNELECDERPKLKALALAIEMEYFTIELFKDKITL